MKNKIAIVTDSTSHFTKEECKQRHIYISSLFISDGEESFKENENISSTWFYNRLQSSKEGVKTSQPAVGEIVELFDKLLTQYEKIIVFSISSRVSGTFQTFCTAKELTAPDKITVFDTEQAGIAKDIQIDYALQQFKEGKEVEVVLAEIDKRKKETFFYVIPADLQQLHRSGRVKTSQFFIGSLLQVKPILEVKDGVIDSCAKVRTHNNIKKWMFNKIAEIKDVVEPELYLYGTPDDEELAIFKDELERLYPTWNISILMLPYSLAVHVGKGSKGFVVQKKA